MECIMPTMISDKFAACERECEERFQTLKRNEEELNRIFIDFYGLQDELTPEVEDKDVTVRRANLSCDIRSLGYLCGRKARVPSLRSYRNIILVMLWS